MSRDFGRYVFTLDLFLDECCRASEDHLVYFSALYKRFQAWARDNHDAVPSDMRFETHLTFGKRLKAYMLSEKFWGCRVTLRNGYSAVVGLDWK
jgi:hypothetical protein